MSLNYTTYVAQLSNLMVQVSTDANFSTQLPGIIDYAEQRIYRELDLQVSRVSDTSTTTSSGVNSITLPSTTQSSPFVVIEQVNILTPAGAISSNGTRNPLNIVTKEYINFAWPTSTATGVPLYAAPLNNTTYYFGPAPDQAYTVEIVGTVRPTPLSASNSSTFLTQYLPDLFMAASMVSGSAYMRDFGAQSDQPGMAQSWEQQYQTLFKSANVEEFRKRFQSQGWQPMNPNATATPPRQ